jgi:hypothetical protein
MCDVSSKVSIFGWHLLSSKLSPHLALVSKGVIVNPHEMSSAFSYLEKEDINHVFFCCEFLKEKKYG